MYEMIRYHLDLGLHEILDTDIIVKIIISYSFIFKWSGGTRVSGLVVQCQELVRFNNDHRLGIMSFTSWAGSTWSVSVVKTY